MKNLFLTIAFVTAWTPFSASPFAAEDPVDIGTRRELFVDEVLTNSLEGEARQVLHHPSPAEVVFVCDHPWEGNGLNFVSMVDDGKQFRMYYRGAEYDTFNGYRQIRPETFCLATSTDGVHWERPNLGIVEYNDSKDNNIILIRTDPEWHHASSQFAPFYDTNPDAPESERFKAIGGLPLWGWVSADGIHWKRTEQPLITQGAFDTLNVCSWDPVQQEYRIFQRGNRDGRDILTAASKDFHQGWSDSEFLDYTPSRGGELYANAIFKYHRAPHYFLGFPTLYVTPGWTPSAKYLPEREFRQERDRANRNYDPGDGYAMTEGHFMASRDGYEFRKYNEAFARPGLRTKDTWFYGDMFPGRGVFETRNMMIEDAPNELSLYYQENNLQPGHPSKMRRYTLRLDGFVSIYAPMAGGRVITKPIRFAGNKLTMNYSSSINGGVRVGLLDENGEPIPEYSLEDCPRIFGDQLERPVEWYVDEEGDDVTADVSSLAGKTVQIVFELKDTDLYSYKFVEE
jgi:hypothetical protein